MEQFGFQANIYSLLSKNNLLVKYLYNVKNWIYSLQLYLFVYILLEFLPVAAVGMFS